MKEPILVVMAAGMGSRYGGLKQMDPVGSNGELIIDFSLYDAWKAGFRKVIFIIKREMEEEFRAMIEPKAGKKLDVSFAFQELTDLPQGYNVPQNRIKPWGTGHAVLAARKEVDAPFAVINADDYYGAQAFQSMYDFLRNVQDDDKYRYCMVGYLVENTLTENGHVARGICQADNQGYLQDITERTKIQRNNGVIQYTEDDQDWIDIAEGTLVSMNLWGFTLSMMKELENRFPAFLETALKNNPLKGEYFLPFVVDELIEEGKATVKVLKSSDKWQGVTYKEDKQNVVLALQLLKDKGVYPQDLWE
ncbi:nucleotidyltransferase family protein [Anaerovorax sp. IOR16]|uniref:nucleotidyltransferase family protein n=1 Tax=Anaerovorax sp. IOR16 TaxID=2773458 RepID=UPI0019CFA1AA|nr:sugar phosphate nucleotidyltransferase [Anaerovorax sp. IOR16]